MYETIKTTKRLGLIHKSNVSTRYYSNPIQGVKHYQNSNSKFILDGGNTVHTPV